MPTQAPSSRRESKLQLTRQNIRDAAMGLFAERGFDAVTVMDIAEGAKVSRSTVFRYFPDKSDVLFEDDAAAHLLLTKAVAGAARTRAPLGDSLTEAVRVSHAGILVLADSKAIQAVRYPMREQLIASHPQLQACSLTRQRGYTDALRGALIEQGSEPTTARMAALIATACYDAGYTEAYDTPASLPDAVDRAFRRLKELRDF
jgi:AcrR family transcriptional regulator